MDLLNRIAIILLILLVMIVVPLLLILPEQAEGVLRYGADLIQANLLWMNSLTPTSQIGMRILLGAVGMIVFVIGVLFLVLEVIRFRRHTVRLKDGSGELMMDGVAGHLAYHIDLLPDVLRVRPDVESKGKSVRASIYVETAPEVNVPAKSAEVQETARRVLEEQLGLHVNGEIKVVLKPIPFPRGRPRPRAEVRVAAPYTPDVPAASTEAGLEDFTPSTPAATPPAQGTGEGDEQVIEVKGR
jgi:hypothetical protein